MLWFSGLSAGSSQVAEREFQDALVDQSIQSGLGDIMFYLGLLGLVQATLGKEGSEGIHGPAKRHISPCCLKGLVNRTAHGLLRRHRAHPW